MFDSPEALLAAYRHENRSRSRRARAQAAVDKRHFSHAITTSLLLEAWACGVAARLTDLLEKEPGERMSTLLKRANGDDLKSRQPVKGHDIFVFVPGIEF